MSVTYPLTRAERSHFRETSLHADVMAFVEALKAKNDTRLVVTSFGVSPEGRDLPLLILSSDGISTPEAAHRTGKLVVLVVNGIHAGEVEGKEAGLMLVRDLLAGHNADILDQMILLVVPLFNPDGNDRIDPANRRLDINKLTGQLGPFTGVGTRTNAAGININRDYMRQDTLEMRLLSSRVYQRWLPHLTVDNHATNGSVHRFDLTYDTPHTVESGRAEPIRLLRERFLPEVTSRLRARTGRETFFYGNFLADEGGVGHGWQTYTHHPRFGSNYRGLTGRLDILAECYSYLSFPERVATTYHFVEEVLLLAAAWHEDLRQVVERSTTPPDRVAIRYQLEQESEWATILTREPRTLEGHPTQVVVPHYARFVGSEVVDRPFAYAIPEALVMKLQGHGLTVRKLGRKVHAQCEVATVIGRVDEGSREILEASAEVDLQVESRLAALELPEGTWIVPASQPFGAVAVYLLEARSDDGLVACGWISEPGAGEKFPAVRILDEV